jgi:anti-sigma factor RsiW
MTELNRNIVIDLLPLYISGEASPETVESIKQYLETDPELAEIAKEMAKANSLGKVPLPFKREAALETYNEAKKWMTTRVIGVVAIIGLVFMCLFTMIGLSSIIDTLAR